MIRIFKLVPMVSALVPPEVGDPEFEMKLHDHRYAVSLAVFTLLVIAVVSYSAAFMPWSPVRIALASDMEVADSRIENLKADLDQRLIAVERKISEVEKAVIEGGLRTRLEQMQSELRSLEDAMFNVQRAIQQRADEGRPIDRIYAERLEQLQIDRARTQERIGAFREEHAALIRRWTLEGA